MAVNLIDIIGNTNTRWMGFRYQLFSANYDFNSQNILLADIAEIEFPSVEIEYRNIPTLSTREYKTPSRKIYGDLVLKSSVIRSPVFFQQIQRQLDVLNGQGDYTNVPNNFIIALYGVNSIVDVLPIRQWFVKNAQPKSFKAAKASANEDGSMPLEELAFVCDEFRAL